MLCRNLYLLALPLLALYVGGSSTASAFYDREADNHGFRVFMEEGGWCWFQDPRAIVSNGKLFIGSVRGNGEGEALVGVYDLELDKAMGSVVMNPQFGRNDHNSPVFHARPDGSVLAVYALHGKDRFHRSRISNPENPLEWSEEVKHERPSPNEKDKVTYMNLYELKDEGLLYNFYRSIEYNPTFVTSEDGGETWSKPQHFIRNEVEGRHRPYARYTSNGKDTIYVSFTDAHPRKFGNSIYFFEYRDGKFYRADGTVVKELQADGPIRPSETDRVYHGSMTSEKPEGFEYSVLGAAWTSSIAVDSKGYPHIAYSVHMSLQDHRYRIASWDGTQWVDREVAYGGSALYPRESSYTGLISLDPVDPEIVYISTDVDPSSGESIGGNHEIYRASITQDDELKSISWHAVTENSPVRNIRPMVVRDGNKRIVLWNRGEFKNYVNYQLDVVGVIEELD